MPANKSCTARDRDFAHVVSAVPIQSLLVQDWKYIVIFDSCDLRIENPIFETLGLRVSKLRVRKSFKF